VKSSSSSSPKPAFPAWKDFAHSSKCRFCGYGTDAASTLDGAKPGPGDVCLCINCGEWNILDRKLRFRKPTDAEYEDIATDPRCQKLRTGWVMMDRERKNEKKGPRL
jgi:hypothetical protein